MSRVRWSLCLVGRVLLGVLLALLCLFSTSVPSWAATISEAETVCVNGGSKLNIGGASGGAALDWNSSARLPDCTLTGASAGTLSLLTATSTSARWFTVTYSGANTKAATRVDVPASTVGGSWGLRVNLPDLQASGTTMVSLRWGSGGFLLDAFDVTAAPAPEPTPTAEPTTEPTTEPSTEPSPTAEPSTEPTSEPSSEPSPSSEPTTEPTTEPAPADPVVVTLHESQWETFLAGFAVLLFFVVLHVVASFGRRNRG